MTKRLTPAQMVQNAFARNKERGKGETIAETARRFGVSRGFMSKVLRGEKQLSEERRAQAQAYARGHAVKPVETKANRRATLAENENGRRIMMTRSEKEAARAVKKEREATGYRPRNLTVVAHYRRDFTYPHRKDNASERTNQLLAHGLTEAQQQMIEDGDFAGVIREHNPFVLEVVDIHSYTLT